MLAYSIVKYLILDQCIETLFSKVYFNFKTPDDRIVKIIHEIYTIYSRAKLDEGINVGSFDDFYNEQLRVYGNTRDPYGLLRIQLNYMRGKYPNYVEN